MKKQLWVLLVMFSLNLTGTIAAAQSQQNGLVQLPNVPPKVTEAFEQDFGDYLDELELLNIPYEILWFLDPGTPVEGWPLAFGSYKISMLFDGDELHHFGVAYRSNGRSLRDDF